MKLADANLIGLDSLEIAEIKTKTIASMLKAINAEGKTLIVTLDADSNVVKSAANMPNVKVAFVGSLNVYDILKYKNFVATKDALEKICEVYA
jgi:large subunit ribosomal protein L4